MKEDILEQIVDDFLQLDGYFTTHNIPFRPDKLHDEYDGRKDSVASDIDVLGYRPGPRDSSGACGLMQGVAGGNGPAHQAPGTQAHLPAGNHRKAWQQFREIWKPKWSEAFHAAVFSRTSEQTFTYCVAVTRLNGPLNADEAAALWMAEPIIRDSLKGCPLRFLTLEHMWLTVLDKTATRPAPSDIGRLAQFLQAARLAHRESL